MTATVYSTTWGVLMLPPRTPNRVDKFRQTLTPEPEGVMGMWENASSSILGTLADATGVEAFRTSPNEAGAGMVAGLNPVANRDFLLGAVGQQAGRLGLPDSTSRAAGTSTLNNPMGAPAALGQVAVAPLGLGLAAYETGLRAINTSFAGTSLLYEGAAAAKLGVKSATPILNDGWQWQDVPDIYKMAWGQEETVVGENGETIQHINAITAGQGMATFFGRTLLHLADAVVPADLQASVDNKIAEDSAAAMNDPTNSRMLYSSLSGLGSAFDVSSFQERESAYNQGAGRWITGISDGAIQWYVGPDVLALKAAGMASRSLFIRSIDDLSDLTKMQASLASHAAYRAGTEGGKRTTLGRLAESLAKLPEEKIAFHPIAKHSTDRGWTARAFGNAKTYDEVSEVLLAMSGDMPAVERLFSRDAILGGALKAKIEEIVTARRNFDFYDNLPKPGIKQGGDAFLTRQLEQIVEREAGLQKELDQMALENNQLQAAVAGFSKNAGIPSAAALRQFDLSRLPFGPKSVGKMEASAEKAFERTQGRHLYKVTELKTGGTFGRTVRVFHSGVDYWKTARIAGFARLSSSNDTLAELENSMAVNPMLRALQKKNPGETFLPGSDTLVSEFRREMFTRMVQARTATERFVVMKDYEQKMYAAHAAYHNVSPETAKAILTRYEGLRTGIVDQLTRKGWFEDSGDIIVTPEMQSMLAEGMPTMDFNFVNMVLRLDAGSASARGQMVGSRALSGFDSLWRPLVLMRLGYTQRNVVEGWMREAAAFGSIGALTGRSGALDRGIVGGDRAAIRWASATGRGMSRVGRVRYGRKGKILSDLNARQAFATRRNAEATKLQKELDASDARMAQIRAGALARARERLILEEQLGMGSRASNTMDEVDTAVKGRQTDLEDTVDEFITDPSYIKPLANLVGKKQSNVAEGFATEEDVIARQLATGGPATGQLENFNSQLFGDPIEGYPGTQTLTDTTVMDFLSPRNAASYNRLRAKYVANEVPLTKKELDRMSALEGTAMNVARARIEAAGGHMVKTVDPKNGVYQLLRDDDWTSYDVFDGTISYIPAENLAKIEFTRTKAYGGVMDLRVSKMREKQEPIVADLRKKLDLEADRDDGWTERLNQDLDDIYFNLFDRSSQPTIETPYTLSIILDAADKDPEIFAQIAFSTWLRRIERASVEGEAFVKFIRNQGLVAPSSYWKRLQAERRKNVGEIERTKEKDRVLVASIRAKLEDDEYLIANITDENGDLMLLDEQALSVHGGSRFVWDGKVRIDPITVYHLKGPGLYNSEVPSMGGSYVVSFLREVSDDLFRPLDGRKFSDLKVYIIRFRDDFSVGERRFVDLDELMDEPQAVENALATVKGAWGRVWDEPFPEDEFDQLIFDVIDERGPKREMNYFGSGKAPDYSPEKFDDWFTALQLMHRKYMIQSDESLETSGLYETQAEFWEAWTEQVLSEGAWGLKHMGGGVRGNSESMHQVYILYTDDGVEMIDADILTDEMIKLDGLRARVKAIEKLAYGNPAQKSMALSLLEESAFEKLTNSKKAALAAYQARFGVGKTLIDDPTVPSGFRAIVHPDMMSVDSNTMESALPGKVVERSYQDVMAQQYDVEELANHPNVWNPAGTPDKELLADLGGNVDVFNLLRGRSGQRAVFPTNRAAELNDRPGMKGLKASAPETRAALVRYMEANGFTHVQIYGKNSTKTVSSAELIGNKQVGASYGAAIDASVVEQRANLILSRSAEYWDESIKAADLRQNIEGAQSALASAEAAAKAVAEKYRKRAGPAASGAQVKPKIGSGTERFTGANFEAFDMQGPFAANQQGGKWMELSGAGDRVLADLYGYSAQAMANLRRTTQVTKYSPGEPLYFETLAREVNRLWRNDPIGLAVAQGRSDFDILDNILFGTDRGKAWLRDSQDFAPFKGMIDKGTLTDAVREDMADVIAQRREIFEKMIPDQSVRDSIAAGDVSPQYLQAELGWRGDLADLEGLGLSYHYRGLVKETTGKIMHVLGTMPENAAVRHPFFRARWREEMQRQSDLYGAQGVTSFDEATINAMNEVAKNYALQQTIETLYTIQRLSTPAFLMKFIAPFFPAWASSMRFWMLKMPAEHPEVIARYAMLWNAPESLGMVKDQEGNRVAAPETLGGKILAKFSGGTDNKIVIQTSGVVAEKLQAITGTPVIRISKPSIDFLLQGEHFFIPGFGPFVTLPVSWFAAQMPDLASAIHTGNITQGAIPELDAFVSKSELTKILYESVLPFGPTKEKSVLGAATENILPAGANKFYQAFQGMGSDEFTAAANSLHRDQVTDWENSGRVGEKPNLFDAVGQAKVLYIFRGLLNYTMPVASGFESKYQFYIDEGRRLQEEERTSTVVDPEGRSYYSRAQDRFIKLHGLSFFRYFKSVSAGSSGMGPNVGEFNEYASNPQLMASLASRGDDASFITMALRPYATDEQFNPEVYAYQMNQPIEGAPGKYLRGGQAIDFEVQVQREIGWYEYIKVDRMIQALRDTKKYSPESIDALKRKRVAALGEQYPDWWVVKQDMSGSRSIEGVQSLQNILQDPVFMSKHGKDPYVAAMGSWYNSRKSIVNELARRAANGGSANIEAKSNVELAAYVSKLVAQAAALDPSGDFMDMYGRFLESDKFLAIPGVDY